MNPIKRFIVGQAAKFIIQDEQKKIIQSTANPFFTSTGRTVIWQGQRMQSFIDDGYTGNDIVFSIIGLIKEKCKIPEWGEYNVKDEQAYKQFQAKIKRPDLTRDFKALMDLRHKALEPVKGYSKIKELLTYPNEQDTWADLVEKWAGWKLSTGNMFTYGPTIEGGANKGLPNKLYDLPTQFMQIFSDRETFPIMPIGYQMTLDGYRDFNLNEIIHDKYWNPRWDTVGGQLFGLAPLFAAAKLLTRDNEGKTAMVADFQNGGPAVIIGLKQVGNTPPNLTMGNEAAALKKIIVESSGAKNRGKMAATGYEPVVARTGVPAVEMEILKAELSNMRSLCNVFGGIPSELLNDPENKSYNNKREAEKALTVRAAIPLLCSIEGQINRKKNTMISSGGWGNNNGTVVGYDMSCFQELEENKSEQVAWLKQADWIALKQKYEIMGLSIPPYIDQTLLEEIYLSSGQTSISDMQVGVDLPINMNDYQKP